MVFILLVLHNLFVKKEIEKVWEVAVAEDGDFLPPDTSISLLDAKNKCISTIGCLGITFSGTNEQPDGLIPMVYSDFSTSED